MCVDSHIFQLQRFIPLKRTFTVKHTKLHSLLSCDHSVANSTPPLGADPQNMASPLPQLLIHTRTEGVQNIKGHKSLDSPGKAASMNAVSTSAAEIMFAQSQHQCRILMFFATDRNHILQVHIRRIATFFDELQESLKISLPQC